MSKNIVIARGDDWEGLYVDGELLEEGHAISLEDALESLGFDVNVMWCQNFLDSIGGLPKNVAEVNWD